MQDKGWRAGQKEKLLNSLEDWELQQIKKNREYLQLDKDTNRAKVILQCDGVRRIRDKCLIAIKKMLNEIKNMQVTIRRHRTELASSDIKTELKPGTPMTEPELQVLIASFEGQSWTISMDLVKELNELQSTIDRHDPGKNVIYTEEQFNKEVERIQKEIAIYGYDMFDENLR